MDPNKLKDAPPPSVNVWEKRKAETQHKPQPKAHSEPERPPPQNNSSPPKEEQRETRPEHSRQTQVIT